MFMELLPELLEQVVLFLSGSDLKELSCCCKQLNIIIKEYLWRKVAITFSTLSSAEFSVKNLEWFRFTKYLSITDPDRRNQRGPKEWKQIAANFKTLTTVCNPVLLALELRSELMAQRSRGWSNLKEFYLRLADPCAESIFSFTDTLPSSLKTLDISLAVIGTSFFELGSFCRFPTLEQLSMRDCCLTNRALEFVNYLTSLKHLHLDRNSINNEGLKILTSLKNLTLLSVSQCYSVGDKGMVYLSQFPALDTLDVSLTGVGDEGMVLISMVTTLQRLRLRDTNVTDAGMQYVEKLQNLRILCIGECQYLTDAAMQHVSRLKQLQVLGAVSHRFTDRACSLIAKMQLLKVVNLSLNNIGDSGIKFLCQLHNLEELDIYECGVTEESEKYIRLMANLRVIDLSANGISDNFVTSICRNRPLSVIKLEGHEEFCLRDHWPAQLCAPVQ